MLIHTRKLEIDENSESYKKKVKMLVFTLKS